MRMGQVGMTGERIKHTKLGNVKKLIFRYTSRMSATSDKDFQLLIKKEKFTGQGLNKMALSST